MMRRSLWMSAVLVGVVVLAASVSAIDVEGSDDTLASPSPSASSMPAPGTMKVASGGSGGSGSTGSAATQAARSGMSKSTVAFIVGGVVGGMAVAVPLTAMFVKKSLTASRARKLAVQAYTSRPSRSRAGSPGRNSRSSRSSRNKQQPPNSPPTLISANWRPARSSPLRKSVTYYDGCISSPVPLARPPRTPVPVTNPGARVPIAVRTTRRKATAVAEQLMTAVMPQMERPCTPSPSPEYMMSPNTPEML